MCFINELKLKYQIKTETENAFIKEMNGKFRIVAQEKLLSIKKKIVGHITEISNKLILIYQSKIEDFEKKKLLPFKILEIDLSKDEEMKIVYNIPDEFRFCQCQNTIIHF